MMNWIIVPCTFYFILVSSSISIDEWSLSHAVIVQHNRRRLLRRKTTFLNWSKSLLSLDVHTLQLRFICLNYFPSAEISKDCHSHSHNRHTYFWSKLTHFFASYSWLTERNAVYTMIHYYWLGYRPVRFEWIKTFSEYHPIVLQCQK